MDPALIFFAALAAFLCYRLYLVLGTRGGHEPDESERVPFGADSAANDTPAEPKPTVVAPAPLPAWAETVKRNYPAFEVNTFLEGANSAYEMIVQAFARGDLSEIEAFISPDVKTAFQSAIDARNAANQTMDVTFVSVERASVLRSMDDGDEVKVIVEFQSDQVRTVKDAEGNVVDGDLNRIDLVKDIWTFARPKTSTDPNWTLTATDAAAQPTTEE